MNEIIRPNCNKAFKVDEAGYADILKQVRDHQFEEELKNRLNLAEKEKEYIFKYNSKEEGYNRDVGGGFKKSVYQYDLDENLVSEYDSLESVANAVNADKKTISNTCLGKNKSCKDFFWSFKLYLNYKVEDNRKKPVLQFDLEGNLLAEYISATETSRPHTSTTLSSRQDVVLSPSKLGERLVVEPMRSFSPLCVELFLFKLVPNGTLRLHNF